MNDPAFDDYALFTPHRGVPSRPAVTVTKRDAAVLTWLGQVRIASTDTMHSAYTHFGGSPLSRQRLSQRLGRLIAAGELGSAVLRRGNNRRVYWPARERYPLAHRELAHDLLVAHMSIMLLGAGDAAFLSYNREAASGERQWTPDMPFIGRASLADGLLWLPDDRTVIVEIELTAKSTRRMTTILASHADRLSSRSDPAAYLLYLTTYRVGQAVAAVWRQNGHAIDHPDRMQIIHAIDDLTLGAAANARTIPILA